MRGCEHQPCYLLAVHLWASGTASLCRFLLSHVSEQWYQPHAAGHEHAWHRPEPYEGQTPALPSLEEDSLAHRALGPPPHPAPTATETNSAYHVNGASRGGHTEASHTLPVSLKSMNSLDRRLVRSSMMSRRSWYCSSSAVTSILCRPKLFFEYTCSRVRQASYKFMALDWKKAGRSYATRENLAAK